MGKCKHQSRSPSEKKKKKEKSRDREKGKMKEKEKENQSRKKERGRKDQKYLDSLNQIKLVQVSGLWPMMLRLDQQKKI